MLHYMLYKALADERTRDRVAAARRYQLTAPAVDDSRDATERASRLRHVTARMVALLNGVRGARSAVTSSHGGSTLTSASGAGPIGCAT